jgi:hypothetical protein
MTRSRMTLSVDEPNKIFTLRYIGSIDGDEVNESVLQQLAQMTAPWEYDTIVDQRRHEGTILTAEIEELGLRWSQFAQGRDAGRLIAIVSEDSLVHARLSLSQAAFPQRVLKGFARMEEGVDWIMSQRAKARPSSDPFVPA